jgi:hypothetical protein
MGAGAVVSATVVGTRGEEALWLAASSLSTQAHMSTRLATATIITSERYGTGRC